MTHRAPWWRALASGALVALAFGCGAEDVGEEQMEIGCAERHDLEAYWVAFEGEGLEAFEGVRVVALTEMRLAFEPDSACATRAAATVSGGRFSVTLEGRTDGAAYPLVGVYLDRSGDGTCDGAADPAWHVIASVPPGGILPVSVTADTVARYPSEESCAPFR